MAEKKSDKKLIIGAVVIGILIITIGILVYVNYIANPNTQNPLQDSSQQDADNNPPKETNPKTYYVIIINHAFSPAELTIKSRDTVRWINQDSTSHTVKSDFGFEIDSPTLSVGASYSHAFQNAGTYDYSSPSYPSMRGSIIVK